MNLHDSRTIYSRSNPMIQELCEFLIINREYIHVAFGWTYSENVSPVSIINDLFNYLGIKVQLKQQEPHTYPLREVLRGMHAS